MRALFFWYDATMTRQPEGRLVKAAKRRIEKRGGRCFNIHGGDNPFQEVGIPDLLVCYKSRFLGLEFKQPGEVPSAKQKHVLRSIEAAGGYSACITSMRQLDRLLAKVDREVDD